MNPKPPPTSVPSPGKHSKTNRPKSGPSRKSGESSRPKYNSNEDIPLLSKHIKANTSNAAFLLKIFSEISPEIIDLITKECNIIFQCKICQNLFRSVANFLVHKRGYCFEKTDQLLHHDWDIRHSTPEKNILLSRSTTRKDIMSLFESMKQIVTENVQPENVVLQDMVQTNKGFFNLRYESQDPSKEPVTILPVEIPVINGIGDSITTNNNSCSICQKEFSSLKLLNVHMKKEHDTFKTSFICPCCKKTFASTQSVYRHLKNVHRKTVEQVQKLQHQIQKKQVPVENPNKSKKTVEISAKERRNQDKGFMEDLREHGSLQKCSGCGKLFDRKVARLAHSSNCQKKVTPPPDLIRSVRRKSLMPMKAVEEKKAMFDGPVSDDQLVRLQQLDPRVILTKTNLSSLLHDKSLLKGKYKDESPSSKSDDYIKALIQEFQGDVEYNGASEDLLNKLHSKFPVEESVYPSDSDSEQNYSRSSSYKEINSDLENKSKPLNSLTQEGNTTFQENIRSQEEDILSQDEKDHSEDEDALIQNGEVLPEDLLQDGNIQSLGKGINSEYSIFSEEESVTVEEEYGNVEICNITEEVSILSSMEDVASQANDNLVEEAEQNIKQNTIVFIEITDSHDFEEVDEENIETQEISPENSDMLLDENGEAVPGRSGSDANLRIEKSNEKSSSTHRNIDGVHVTSGHSIEEQEKEIVPVDEDSQNERRESHDMSSVNYDQQDSRLSDIGEDIECGFLVFPGLKPDKSGSKENGLDQFTGTNNSINKTKTPIKLNDYESFSEKNSKDCSSLGTDKENTFDNVSHSSYISMKHTTMFIGSSSRGESSQDDGSPPIYDLDENSCGVEKEIVLLNDSEGFTSAHDPFDSSLPTKSLPGRGSQELNSRNERRRSLSPTQSLDHYDRQSYTDNTDWLAKEVNLYVDSKKKKCLLCFKTFHRVQLVRRHVASHFNIYKFKCLMNSCNFLSYYRADMNNHFYKVHKKKTEREFEHFVGKLHPKKDAFKYYDPYPLPFYLESKVKSNNAELDKKSEFTLTGKEEGCQKELRFNHDRQDSRLSDIEDMECDFLGFTNVAPDLENDCDSVSKQNSEDYQCV